MANRTLLSKSIKQISILLLLLIVSPILLTMAFKAIDLYDNSMMSIIFLVIASALMLFTILFAFKVFRLLIKAIFAD